jgi:hypothetical protein
VTYSPRRFIVCPDDTLYGLASAKFSRMVDEPDHHRLVRFAGQRVRMVEAIVVIRDRTPCAVIRLACQMLGFDARGRLDRRAFMRQNVALADLVAGRVLGGATTTEATIMEVSSRFVARGGLWQPSPSLEQRILRAALGELKGEQL